VPSNTLTPVHSFAKSEGDMPNWLNDISFGSENCGFYERFGVHAASFVDRGDHQLVISFDNLSDAGNPRYDVRPWADAFIKSEGWSHLGIYARGPSWFRDQRLIDFFERLRKEKFFKRFDKIALTGTSMGGYAALSFATFTPGATVIALSPQSTLDKKDVPWETRFAKGQKQDWTLPYSDAAKTIGKIERAYVLYDPSFKQDVRHIDRLPQDRLIRLKGFWFGHKTAVVMRRLEKLKPFMRGAVNGTLSEAEFYEMARGRKDLVLYRRHVEADLDERGRDGLKVKFRQAFRKRRRDAAKLD
jgi:hypothetical protein